VLDLTKPAGRDALLKLVPTPTSSSPTSNLRCSQKFALTWDDLNYVNPRLVYALITVRRKGTDADSPPTTGSPTGRVRADDQRDWRRRDSGGVVRDGRSSDRCYFVRRDHARLYRRESNRKRIKVTPR